MIYCENVTDVVFLKHLYVLTRYCYTGTTNFFTIFIFTIIEVSISYRTKTTTESKFTVKKL